MTTPRKPLPQHAKDALAEIQIQVRKGQTLIDKTVNKDPSTADFYKMAALVALVFNQIDNEVNSINRE